MLKIIVVCLDDGCVCMTTEVEANVGPAHTLMAASPVSFLRFWNQRDPTRLQDLLFLCKCSCVRAEGEPLLFTADCCWGSWYHAVYCCFSGALVCLLVKPCVSEALRFVSSCVSFSVIQVLASPWDTCVAISGEFPVLILRTNPLVVIVYISSSGFFSLWLLLFSVCPSHWIESSCCPLLCPDYRLSCSLFFFII